MKILRFMFLILVLISCTSDDEYSQVITQGDLMGKWMFSHIGETSNINYVFNSDFTMEEFVDSNSRRMNSWSLYEPTEGGAQYQSLAIRWNQNNDNWSSYELISFKKGIIKMKTANSSSGMSYGYYILTKVN